MQQRINPALRVSGVILCMYETTTRLAGEVLADIKAFFADARNSPTVWAQAKIFETVVRRNIKLAECPSHGLTIFDYEPRCRGAEDYNALADEVLSFCAQAREGADAQSPPAQPDGPTPTDQSSPADEAAPKSETPSATSAQHAPQTESLAAPHAGAAEASPRPAEGLQQS